MPVFTYRGVNRAGSSVAGERAAASKAELAASLKREQINVSKLSEKGKEFAFPTFGTGVDAKELAIFTRQFSVMIDAGLPLVQCLEILAGQQENKSFSENSEWSPRVGGGRCDAFGLHEIVRQSL